MVSAPALGAGGREFESLHPDHTYEMELRWRVASRGSVGPATNRFDDRFAGRSPSGLLISLPVTNSITDSAWTRSLTASARPRTSRDSSRLSRSTGFMRIAAGRPLRVTTTRSCSRFTRSTNSENRSFTLRRESVVMATVAPRIEWVSNLAVDGGDPDVARKLIDVSRMYQSVEHRTVSPRQRAGHPETALGQIR